MANASIVASTVVVPEPEINTPTESLKRRRSSVSSTDSKRPRLDTAAKREGLPYDEAASVSTPADDARSSQGASPVERRRQSAAAPNKEEERKRNKRLFGGLLGALAQSSSTRTTKRKEEAEKKQQAKLKQLDEKQATEDKLRKEELDRERRDQQLRWDATSKRIRHDNMRATAQSLVTEQSPKLYFKPWDLLPRQAERIKTQIADVEAKIAAENDDGQSIKPEATAEGASVEMEADEVKQDAEAQTVGTNTQERTDTPAKADLEVQNTGETGSSNATVDAADKVSNVVEEIVEDIEEVTEGGEDAVIY